jgi:nucleotide-binding universal stress UspA family protein
LVRMVVDMSGGILAFGCDVLPAFRHRRTASGLIEIAGCAREMQMHRAEARLLDIRRILCPVDFSDASRHAWDHAVVIAGWYGASITALHVCNPVFPAEPPISFAELPKTTERLTGADRRELEADLAPWLEAACAGGVVADVVFDEGHNPGVTIPVFAVTAVWMLAAMVVAVRQALDYQSTARAIAVCGVGWALAIVIAIVLGLVFGPTLS